MFIYCSKYLRDQSQRSILKTCKEAKFQTFKGANSAQLIFKSVAIPAIDLTISSVIQCLNVFERIKVIIAKALIHLCFGGDSPLGYVKTQVLLFQLCFVLLHSRATVVMRASPVRRRPQTSFSRIPLNELMPNFGDRYLSTIPPDHFFCFSKF